MICSTIRASVGCNGISNARADCCTPSITVNAIQRCLLMSRSKSLWERLLFAVPP